MMTLASQPDPRNIQPVPSAALSLNALTEVFQAHDDNARLLLDETADKNKRSRLALYVQWLDDTDGHWTRPALSAYAAYLMSDARETQPDEHGERTALNSLSASSTQSHLSTIRGRFRQLVDDPAFHETLQAFADAAFVDASPADRQTFISVMTSNIRRALDQKIEIKRATKQDEIDSDKIRLTRHQAESLLKSPSIGTLQGLRDTALIAVMLCTGLREAEVTGLDVVDLRRKSDGSLGVHVRDGKGSKSRFVPYGSGVWCLSYVDAWLNNAGIKDGAVFRGFTDRWMLKYAPGEHPADEIRERLTERMTPRTVQRILKKYPVMIDGQLQAVRPHDLRHTYAKRSYDSGRAIAYGFK